MSHFCVRCSAAAAGGGRFNFYFFDRVGNQYVYDSKVSYKDLLQLLEWMDYRVKQELLLLLHFSAP